MTLDELARSIGQRLQQRGFDVGVEPGPQCTVLSVGGRCFILAENAGTKWIMIDMVGGPQNQLPRDERGVLDGAAFIERCVPKTQAD